MAEEQQDALARKREQERLQRERHERHLQQQLKDVNTEVDVRSDLWPVMSIDDLWSQRSLLDLRLGTARSMSNGGIVQQITAGIKFLDVIIEEKTQKELSLADQVVLRG